MSHKYAVAISVCSDIPSLIKTLALEGSPYLTPCRKYVSRDIKISTWNASVSSTLLSSFILM